MDRLRGALIVAAGMVALATWSAAGAEIISGAGSTFVFPVLVKWAAAYEAQTGIRIAYQSVGSGAGIRYIKNSTVDFGASDAPLPAEELATADLVQFPIVVGGVVPVVNVDGIGPGQLRLTGTILADIYLGNIAKWNDQAILDLNPDLALPDQAIIPVHRADGSGTTYVFADYLARVSPEWKKSVGVGTAVEFPAGIGGKGNDGVAATTASTKGTIGYVEYSYIKRNHLAYALVKNHDGSYVSPSRQTFQSAAAHAGWTKAAAFYMLLSDQAGADTWPIVGSTFILLHKKQTNEATARRMLSFFDWVYRNGAAIAEQLDYSAMPIESVEMFEAGWHEIKMPDGNVAWTANNTSPH